MSNVNKLQVNPKNILNDVQVVLALALFFLCLGCYLNFVWRKRQMFIKSWNFPGPLNLPLIGAAYYFMCRPEWILRRITNLQSKHPGGIKLWFGNRLIYCLHEPDHIEKVLGSTRLVQKEYLYKHLTDSIGEGLITAPVPKWKKHRKNILPSFNQKVLDSFVEVFAEQGAVLNEILAENCGKDIDIYGLMSRCTLDILCETAMGLRMNIQKTNADYGYTFDKIMLLTFLKIFQIWNHVDFIWRFLGYEKRIKSHLKKFSDLADKVIKEKMEAMEAKKNRKPSIVCVEEVSQKRMAFLDLMMLNSNFDEIELRDEVNLFLFAGTDTTASAMSFVFATLGMFPDVQQKVYEEVIQIMGPDRQPEFKDLPHLHYTERFIKETLRLFPVGAFFLRAITEDVDCGDMVLPKGASAYFGTVFIHRNAKYWPDPLKFDPDRFLPEEIAKRPPCAYIPFSFGPRNCIGMKYGIMNMKTLIATVVRKFRIHCDYKSIEEIKLKANIVLRFQHGAKVSVTLRELVQ